MLEVVDEEAGPDEEHQDGDQLGDAAGDHGLGGVAGVAAAENALGVELVGPEGGHVLERHGQKSDPEGELHGGIGAEVEDAEFAGLAGLVQESSPASIKRANNPEEGEDAAKDENTELDHIGPDDGGHPAHQRPEDGKAADDPDAEVKIDPGAGTEDQGGDEEANALAEDGAEEEKKGGKPFGSVAQPMADVVIGTEDFPLVKNADEP